MKNELWKKYKKPAVKDEVTILDALSATGLRSVRYSLECTECSLPIKVIANDISMPAIEQIKTNIEENNLKNVVVNHDDASMFMYKSKASNDRITVIDLDPYGSPAPFLDSAIQAITDGGLLMVTCTDMAVLAGNHGEKCYALYGSFPVKAKFCHEMALRILLHSVQSHATRYGRYIVPLLSLSIDFYIRIFLQVFTSPLEARKSTSKQSYIYICNTCESFKLQPMTENRTKDQNAPLFAASKVKNDSKCKLCDRDMQIGGPLWSAPIHDIEFVNFMKDELNAKLSDFGTQRRMSGILELISEELNDIPLYYHLDRLCSLACSACPPMRLFRSALLNAGFRVSYSHALKNSIKTDAPNEFLWAIIKRFMAERNEEPKEYCRAYPILVKNFEYEVKLDAANDAEPESKNKRLLRYQINPEDNWGPKARPGVVDELDKREKNQGKYSTNKKMKMDNSNSEPSEEPQDIQT